MTKYNLKQLEDQIENFFTQHGDTLKAATLVVFIEDQYGLSKMVTFTTTNKKQGEEIGRGL